MLEQQFLQLCDEPDWEGIQLKRTPENTLGEGAPLQHILEGDTGESAEADEMHMGLQLQKQGFLISYKTSFFHLRKGISTGCGSILY